MRTKTNMATIRHPRALAHVKTLINRAHAARCVAAAPRTFVREYCNKVAYATNYTESRAKVRYLTELYKRRLKAGPEQERHPSAYGCWNHDTELYAFGQRYGEEFDEQLLKRAFRQKTWVEAENSKQEELGIELEELLQDNTELAEKGRALASRYIKAYLRASYPQLFEEGVCAIHDYLLSSETLYRIASISGLRDLIQSIEYPPLEEHHITTFMAVIGALVESKGDKRAEMFVGDLIVPQLIGKDIAELWHMENPMGLLSECLKSQGRGAPESRLLWSSAKNTILATHHVGIYSDKQLIGKSPGETVFIAEELAARDALKNLFKMADNQYPLKFGRKVHELNLDYDQENPSLKKFLPTS